MFKAWEEALMLECRSATLATVARDGTPNTVPVCFAYFEDAIAIAIDEKPKEGTRLARLRNIERDPRVSLLIDRYDDDWSQLAWVRIEGTADICDRGDKWPAALQALRGRYWQYGDMALEELPVIRIAPRRVVSWRWKESTP
jgi:PPOX class probable F420-dependent enzyme